MYFFRSEARFISAVGFKSIVALVLIVLLIIKLGFKLIWWILCLPFRLIWWLIKLIFKKKEGNDAETDY